MADEITLPHHFSPRPYQIPLLRALDKGGATRAVACWHRRAGKDKVAARLKRSAATRGEHITSPRSARCTAAIKSSTDPSCAT